MNLSGVGYASALIVGYGYDEGAGLVGDGTLNVLPGDTLMADTITVGDYDDLSLPSPVEGTLNHVGGTVDVVGAITIGTRGATGFYGISGGILDVDDNLDIKSGVLTVTGADASIDVLRNFTVRENGVLNVVFDDAIGISTIAAHNGITLVSSGGNKPELQVELATGVAFNTNDIFTLMDADDWIIGEFEGLGQNAIIQIDGLDTFRIHYDYTTSFDVTLTALRNVDLSVAGDLDFDGDVDGADFLLWQRGGSPSPLSPSDLLAWKTNFGPTSPLSAASSAVPESSSLFILMVGFMMTAAGFHHETLKDPPKAPGSPGDLPR